MTDVGAAHPAMPVWPKDTTAAKNAFYGEFHRPDWQGKF